MREKVAAEYGIALYRRYREKQAATIVGYEATWWKRHRKKGSIPFIQDPGGGIGYMGYMLCDIIILGKGAVKVAEKAPTPPSQPSPPDAPQESPTDIAGKILRGGKS